jgi:hypothetical protein
MLAEFAGLIPVESVRLASSSEQWPDGYVKLSGKTHYIEVTSTHGGRKLGEEYRGVKAPTLDPVSNWAARAESVARYLDEAIAAKIRKKYGSAYWLVVYLNIDEYGIRQTETELVIHTIKARYAPIPRHNNRFHLHIPVVFSITCQSLASDSKARPNQSRRAFRDHPRIPTIETPGR